MKTKNIPKIRMFPNRFHVKKMKNKVVGSLVNIESSARWLKPWSWYTSSGDGRNGGGFYYLSLKVEEGSLEKTMENLTPNGVFIRFSTRFKWLEPTKGLGHLI